MGRRLARAGGGKGGRGRGAHFILDLALVLVASGCDGSAEGGRGGIEARIDLGPLAMRSRQDTSPPRYVQLAEYDGENHGCEGALADPSEPLPEDFQFKSIALALDPSSQTVSFTGVRAGGNQLIVLDILEVRDETEPPVVIARGCVDGQVIAAETASGSNPTPINGGEPIPLVSADEPSIEWLSSAVVWPGAELALAGRGFTNVIENLEVTLPARKGSARVAANILAANPWEIRIAIPAGVRLGFLRVEVVSPAGARYADSPYEIVPIHTAIGDPIAVRGNPVGIVTEGQKALVVNRRDTQDRLAHLAILDLIERREVVGQIPFDGDPTDVGYVPGLGLVTDESANAIRLFDFTPPYDGFDPTKVVPVGPQPFAIAASGNFALTSNRGNNTVSVVRLDPPAVKTVDLFAQGEVRPAIAISGTVGYAAAGFGLARIDLATGEAQEDKVIVGPSPTALFASGTEGLVTDGLFRSLSRLDFSAGGVVGVPVTLGDTPCAIAVRGARAYVPNLGDDSVSVVDLADWRVMGVAAGVGDEPVDVALAGNFAYVANSAGRTITPLLVSIVEPTGDLVPVGPQPRSVAVVSDLAYVVTAGDRSLHTFDVARQEAGPSAPIGVEPQGIVADGDGLFITHSGSGEAGGELWVLDRRSLAFQWKVTLGGTPSALAVGGGFAYVTDTRRNLLHAVSLAKRSEVSGSPIPLPGLPRGVAVDEGHIYVTMADSDEVAVFGVTTRKEDGPRIPTGVFPTAIAVARGRAYVANSGEDTVSILDLATRTAVGERVSTGRLPISVAVGERFVYVLSSVAGTVTAIHLDTGESFTSEPSPGVFPVWLAVSGDTGLVANEGSGTVALFDLRVR